MENPYNVEAWSIVITNELMKARNYERVAKPFVIRLGKTPIVSIWRAYLNFIKRTKGSLPSYREKMAQAYEFALDKMGMDIMSYPIWNDYITFLKNVEAVAEGQSKTAVRKVYQRGIVNPMANIEQLWKDYVSYEQGINPAIADKMIQDMNRDYMNAQRITKEYEAVTRGLNRYKPSTPPQGLPEQIKQVDLWKKYIAWEKGNPLRTEDHAVLTKRVMFAYEQCLLCLGKYPNMWYEAALFLEQSGKLLTEKEDLVAGKLFSEEAAAVYDRATSMFLKTNILLHFAYADFEESQMKYAKVHLIYNRLIENPDIDPTLAYIQYMKFARRAEGIESARTIFFSIRENPKVKYQVFVAAASMEYYCSKDKFAAFNIFELGMKRFGDNPDYVLAYICLLSHLNNDSKTRLLFEHVLTSGSLPPEKQVEIWNQFLEFETNVGDLQRILKIEKRRAAIIEQIAKQNSSLPSSIVTMKKALFVDGKIRKIAYSTPDTAQMIPFKTRQIYPIIPYLVPGGVFLPPPSVSYFMTLLPPPTSFQGPFVDVDDVIRVLKMWRPPEHASRPTMENGTSKNHLKYFEHTVNVTGTKKRKTGDVEEGRMIPSIKDVSHRSQHKKAK